MFVMLCLNYNYVSLHTIFNSVYIWLRCDIDVLTNVSRVSGKKKMMFFLSRLVSLSRVVSQTEQKNSTSLLFPWMSYS
jgi:hypothetical protein